MRLYTFIHLYKILINVLHVKLKSKDVIVAHGVSETDLCHLGPVPTLQ